MRHHSMRLKSFILFLEGNVCNNTNKILIELERNNNARHASTAASRQGVINAINPPYQAPPCYLPTNN
jgi:hypothetical protein